MPFSESVERALDADMDKELPVDSGGDEPFWLVLALPGTSAPIVALSRDPRAGRTVVPVFFVAVDKPAVLTELAKNIPKWSSGKMPLWHEIAGGQTGGFAVFPFLFDRGDDPKMFADVALKLGNIMVSSSIGCAFYVAGCSVMITRDGVTKSSKDYEERFV
ncbi:hypothetical protein N8766_03550 [bacterium]|jgi:hypothetical protein|nr:hypothetical protein [bacterium]MDB4798297.1 hypothetical protein [Verrucomicrobiota bacterium]